MTPDDEVKQSDRFARYEEMFGRLVASGRIYPCYESAQELELQRKVLLSRGLPPVSDRAGLKQPDEDRARPEAEGRRPHWRVRLGQQRIVGWLELRRGPSHQRHTPTRAPEGPRAARRDEAT